MLALPDIKKRSASGWRNRPVPLTKPGKPYRIPAGARSVSRVSAAIRVPADEWDGNCTGVCAAILKARLVKGEQRRGLWLGPISENSSFAKRAFTGHTWIRLPDGRVYDPTRWAFGTVSPYIFVSDEPESQLHEYDFGGNNIRRAFRKPFPVRAPGDKPVVLRVLRSVAIHLVLLAGPGCELRASVSRWGNRAWARLPMTQRQAVWFANLGLTELSEQAKPVYRALVEAGAGALIPWDNRQAILGK